MSQSMQYLRKNQKVILAVTGVICIITFTVGSFILQWVDSAARSTGAEGTVVKWKNGRITEKDMAQMIKAHAVASQAVRNLAMTAMQKGAFPHGLGVNLQGGQLGILIGDSEENVVQIMLLAAKAKSLGIAVDDDTVRQYLRGIAGSPESGLKEGDIKDALQTALGNRMTLHEFFQQMQTELLARYMLALVGTGLDTLPPSEMYTYYERLNRQAQIESFPINVADFVDKVTTKPTDAQLRELFNAHKNELENPNLAGPRFKQPRQIAVQYVKADFAKLVEEEKAKIPEAAVKAEYEKRVADGQFKTPTLPELPATPEKTTPETTDPATPPAEPGDKQEEPKPEATPAPATEEKPAEEPKPEEKPADEKKADEPAAAEPKPEEKPAEPKPDSSSLPNGEVFVAAQDEAAPAAEKKDDEKKTEEAPAAPPVAEEKKADDKPAEAATPATEPKPETPPATPGEATQPPAAAAPAEPAMTVQPFEKVRDQILTSLAREPAQKRMDAAFLIVNNAVLKHGRELQVARSLAKTEKEAEAVGGEPFDIAKVAKEAGLEYGSVPLSNEFQFEEHELGRTTVRNAGRFGNSIPFTSAAFNTQHPLFTPAQVNSTIGDTEFLFWVTEAKPEEIPTFEMARKQVEEAWRFAEAIKLARAEAEKLAKEAASDKSLKDSFANQTVTESGLFSWLTSGFTPFGMGQPRLSDVQGVDRPSTEFMRTVFSLEPGQVGVAPNQPETIFYVVRLSKFVPDEKLLREMFTGGGLPGAAQRVMQGVAMVAQEDHGQLLYEWYESLLKEYNVEWQRDPLAFDS